MIRLDEIQESKIINNGNAGVVSNVSIEVLRKTEEHVKDYPDFKIIFSEQNGASIDIGVYYFKNKDFETEVERSKRTNNYLLRLMHIVKAVKGLDFAPSQGFTSVKEATEFCIDTIEKNSSNKLFNIFITFGTLTYPSKRGFLEVRFNIPFIKNIEDTLTLPLIPFKEDIMDKDELVFLKKKNESDSIITKNI